MMVLLLLWMGLCVCLFDVVIIMMVCNHSTESNKMRMRPSNMSMSKRSHAHTLNSLIRSPSFHRLSEICMST